MANFWNKHFFSCRKISDLSQSKHTLAFTITTADNTWQKNIYLFDGKKTKDLTKGFNPKFSNNGKKLYYLKNYKNKLGLYEYFSKKLLLKTTLEIEDFKLSQDDKFIIILAKKPLKASNSQLFLFSRDTLKQLTFEKGHIVGFSISPNAKKIAFTKQLTNTPGDWYKRYICLIDIDSLKTKVIAKGKNAYENPKFSPCGNFIAYLAIENVENGGGFSSIWLINLKTNKKRKLPSTFNKRSKILGWKNKNTLIILDQEKTRNFIYEISLNNNSIKKKKIAISWLSNISMGKKLFFVGESCNTPPEIYCNNKKITNFNENITSNFTTKQIYIPSYNNKIESLLTYPKKFIREKKYPLVLLVHGGPTSSFTQSFIQQTNSLYPIATLSSLGYFILRCNVIGSMGYGYTFRKDTSLSWGNRDLKELFKCLNTVIKKGFIDTSKIGIIGWSYGGYLASLAISKANLFKAAILGSTISDLQSWILTSDFKSYLQKYFEKFSLNLLKKRSPLHLAKSITTPTLLLHGEKDKRAPLDQAIKLFDVLKTKSKMVIYPNATHFHFSSKQYFDIWEKEVNWIEKHLKNSN